MDEPFWETLAELITTGANNLSSVIAAGADGFIPGVSSGIAANFAWQQLQSAWGKLTFTEQAARTKEYAQLQATLQNAPQDQHNTIVQTELAKLPELLELLRLAGNQTKVDQEVKININGNNNIVNVAGSNQTSTEDQNTAYTEPAEPQSSSDQVADSESSTLEQAKLKEPISLNIDHRQRVAEEIEQQFFVEGSEAMDYLLERLIQKRSLQEEPTIKNIAYSLALVKCVDAVGSSEYKSALNNSLTSLKHAIQETAKFLEAKKQVPSKNWCERMRKAMGALAQLSVDLNALQKQLDDQDMLGVTTPRHQAPTLALVANCYHETNTEIILENDGFVGAGKFPLTPYPHAGAIEDADQHALACLLKQIYHAVEEPGNTLKIDGTSYIQQAEIDDYVESIKQLLEANEKDGYACYAHIDPSKFKNQNWLNALLEIQRRIPLLMFQVQESDGRGRKTGLLIITDALCKRHLTDVWRCTENCQ